MYGIFTYIYHKLMINVGKYSIHGAYGIAIKKIGRNPKAGKAIVSLSNPKFQVGVVSFGGVVCVPSFG